MRELEGTIQNSRETVARLFEEGQAHLATMRGLVSGTGPVQPRADSFAEEAVALAGVIAALEQTSIAPSVSRAAADLSAGFIAPVADGRSGDLAVRQDQVMETVRRSVAAQSEALSAAAAEILAQPKVERRFVPLSSVEAVLSRDELPVEPGRRDLDRSPAGVLVGVMVGVGRSGAARTSRRCGLHHRADMMRSLILREGCRASARRDASRQSSKTKTRRRPKRRLLPDPFVRENDGAVADRTQARRSAMSSRR